MTAAVIDTPEWSDGFCGAGGSSSGIEDAGGTVRVAINHSEIALESHAANFPATFHVQTDLSKADPRQFPKTLLAWFSPACTHHTDARGIKRTSSGPDLWGYEEPEDPDAERSRMTMQDVERMARHHNYHTVIVENVVEAAAKWKHFDEWIGKMHALGYLHEIVCLNSMHAGVPQSRDRIYVVFWKKGNRAPNLAIEPEALCPKCQRIIHAQKAWSNPERKLGKYRQQYIYACPSCQTPVEPFFVPSSTIIDWTLPIHSIGARSDPTYRKQHNLREIKTKTRERVQAGIDRYITPFFIDNVHTPRGAVTSMLSSIEDPFRTILTNKTHMLCDPWILTRSHTGDGNRNYPTNQPMPTITTARGEHAIIAPWITSYYSNIINTPTTEPLGTVTTRDRHALIAGRPTVDDCGLRGLTIPEYMAGQAFREGYIVLGNQDTQMMQIGNAVSPPAAKLLAARVMETL